MIHRLSPLKTCLSSCLWRDRSYPNRMLSSVPISRRPELRVLAEAVESRLERGAGDHPAAARWRESEAAIEGPFGGMLRRGGVHEWFVGEDGESGSGFEGGGRSGTSRAWGAPLAAVMEIVRASAAATAPTGPGEGLCVWVGRRCWPNPEALARVSMSVLHRSLFVHPSGRDERAWALDLCLRSAGVSVVVADGRRLTFNETRRFQLAAEAGGTMGLLVRPPWESREPSAARTRWRATPSLSADADQRWVIELLRCKGARPAARNPRNPRNVLHSEFQEEARRWSARRSHATGDVSVAPHAPHRSLEAETAPGGRIRRAM